MGVHKKVKRNLQERNILLNRNSCAFLTTSCWLWNGNSSSSGWFRFFKCTFWNRYFLNGYCFSCSRPLITTLLMFCLWLCCHRICCHSLSHSPTCFSLAPIISMVFWSSKSNNEGPLPSPPSPPSPFVAVLRTSWSSRVMPFNSKVPSSLKVNTFLCKTPPPTDITSLKSSSGITQDLSISRMQGAKRSLRSDLEIVRMSNHTLMCCCLL